MGRNLLLIAPIFMDIYKDIQKELVRQGYHVDFIPEGKYAEDPDNIRGYKGIKKLLYVRPKKFAKWNSEKWLSLLNSESYNKNYDILFVIDGQSIPKCLFEELRRRNNKLISVNYLFDTCSGVYRFDKNFKEFTRVYSFDRTESDKFGLDFLPIYWIKTSLAVTPKYQIFAFGRYSDIRLRLFKILKRIADENNISAFIKLATDKEKNMLVVKLKWIIRKVMCKTSGHIPPKFYNDEMNTYASVSPMEFRNLIACSDVVVDTNAAHQDGLTARFMWALGAGKKIITTNVSVKKYDFYNPNQILVLDDLDYLDSKLILDFIKQKFIFGEEQKNRVLPYELSNWLKTLLYE